MGLEGQAPGPSPAGLGYQLWGPLDPGVSREIVAAWNRQGRLFQGQFGKTQLVGTEGAGRRRGEGEGRGERSNPNFTAGPELRLRLRSAQVAEEGRSLQATALPRPRGWRQAQGLAQTLKRQWRGESTGTYCPSLPEADSTNQAPSAWQTSGAGITRPLPPSPAQTSDPLHSPASRSPLIGAEASCRPGADTGLELEACVTRAGWRALGGCQ